MTCVNNKLEFFLKLRPVKTSLFKVDIMNFLRKNEEENNCFFVSVGPSSIFGF